MIGSEQVSLSAEAHRRIAAKIDACEAATSGEIVVIVEARAGLYRSFGLALALVAGLATPWPLIWFTGLSAAWIALIQIAVATLVLALTLNFGVRLFCVPRSIRRRRGHAAAQREFLARGLTHTKARTGVLIYVAVAERYAEIVADRGVRERIEDSRWHATVAKLVEAADRNELDFGLETAVEEVGQILRTDLPSGPNENELPNRVIVID